MGRIRYSATSQADSFLFFRPASHKSHKLRLDVLFIFIVPIHLVGIHVCKWASAKGSRSRDEMYDLLRRCI